MTDASAGNWSEWRGWNGGNCPVAAGDYVKVIYSNGIVWIGKQTEIDWNDGVVCYAVWVKCEIQNFEMNINLYKADTGAHEWSLLDGHDDINFNGKIYGKFRNDEPYGDWKICWEVKTYE